MTEDVISDYVRRAPQSRSAWPWVFTVSVTLGVLWQLAPRIELSLYPVFGMEQMGEIERGTNRLCWWRLSQKLRAPEVQNYDTFVDYLSADKVRVVHEFPTVFNPDTDEPISTERAPKVGVTRRHLCVALAPYIGDQRPIRLRQVVHFRGLLGLWDLPVPLQTIYSPPGTVLPP